MVILRAGPRAAGVLPFGLRGQTIGPPLLLAQPFAERRRVVPSHVDHWVLICLAEARVTPRVLGFLRQASLVVKSVTPFPVLLRLGPVARGLHELAELAA